TGTGRAWRQDRPVRRTVACPSWANLVVPEYLWMRSSASGRWSGRGSVAVMVRGAGRGGAVVDFWATAGASALRSVGGASWSPAGGGFSLHWAAASAIR